MCDTSAAPAGDLAFQRCLRVTCFKGLVEMLSTVLLMSKSLQFTCADTLNGTKCVIKLRRFSSASLGYYGFMHYFSLFYNLYNIFLLSKWTQWAQRLVGQAKWQVKGQS